MAHRWFGVGREPRSIDKNTITVYTVYIQNDTYTQFVGEG